MPSQQKLHNMRISAACALCRKDGLDPYEEVNGTPLWTSYLSQVDQVISDSIQSVKIDRLSWTKK